MSILSKVILIFAVLLTNQMFPQTIDKDELRQDNPLQQRIIPHSISDEQFSHPSEQDIFKEGETRTLVNKTMLDNCLLYTSPSPRDRS